MGFAKYFAFEGWPAFRLKNCLIVKKSFTYTHTYNNRSMAGSPGEEESNYNRGV